MKAMKIKVSECQQLKDIIMELDRLGFKPWCVGYIGVVVVATSKKGLYTTFRKDVCDNEVLTTLTELQVMS